jgi:hypothetical protein
MKDKSSDDDRPNGNDPAPPPIRKNAKGKYHQASQYRDFDKSQGPPPSLRNLPRSNRDTTGSSPHTTGISASV